MPLRPLALRFTLALATLLSACGGGSTHADAETATVVQQAADAAVAAGLAGISLAHVTPDGSVQAVAGLRAVGAPARIAPDDVFMIGSTTKAMTAALAGRIVEQGRIAWTTTLAEALPDLAAGMRPEYRGVTLEQLLNHRAGVLAMNNADDLARFEAYLQDASAPLPTTLAGRERFFAAWLLSLPALPLPPEGFAYSNGGYTLAALMLEARTGRDFADLFEQELARPLGLAVTWTAANAPLAGRPVGHLGAKGQLVALEATDADMADWLTLLRPGGGGTTLSAASQARWLGWHLRALRGEVTPLSAGYLQRLRALKAGSYALGWIAADVDGRAVLAHDGEYRGFCSLVVLDVQGRSASLALTNTEPDDGAWVHAVLNQTVLDIERALKP